MDDMFEKVRLSIEMENGRLVTKYETDQEIPVVLKKVKGLILCSFYITGAVSNMDGFVKSEMIAMLEDTIRGVKNGKDSAAEVAINIDRDEFEKQLRELKNDEDE